jgi:hypothetical protein
MARTVLLSFCDTSVWVVLEQIKTERWNQFSNRVAAIMQVTDNKAWVWSTGTEEQGVMGEKLKVGICKISWLIACG